MGRIWMALVVLLACVPRLSWADIEVVESSGVEVTNKKTPIRLDAADPVDIFLVQSRGTAFASSTSGGFASGASQNLQFLCTAPCKLNIDGGHYELQVTNNMLFGHSFKLIADGEPKAYEVNDYNGAEAMLGMILATVGTAMALVLIPYGFILEDGTGMIAGGLGSAAGGALGWWMLYDGKAGARPL